MKETIIQNHYHGFKTPKYVQFGERGKWFCKRCKKDITGIPLLAIVIKKP